VAISIPANAPPPLPQTPIQVEVLALREGQVVEARVVGVGTGGNTQLTVNGQLVDAALSVRLKPDVLIQLLVQGSGSNSKLTVLPQPSQGQGQPAVPTQPGAQPQPQSQPTQVVSQLGSTIAPAQTSTSATYQGQMPTQPVATQTAASQTTTINVQPSMVPVPLSNAPTQAATPQAPNVTAISTGVTGTTQTSPAAVQLEPGTVFRVQIQGSGTTARPVLVPVTNPNTASPSNQTSAQNIVPLAVQSQLQQAVSQTVQNAVVRQDSITTLLTSLAGLGAKLADLPKPVAQAGAEVLAGRLNLSAKPLDGEGLKQALTRSGVLFENTLQKSAGQPLPQGDLKSALLSLRSELRLWLGGDAQVKPQSQQPPPPPTPGAHPRASKPVNLPLPPNLSGTEAGARLAGQSEAARMQLSQLSSLSDGSFRSAQGPAGAASEINIELPMLFGGEMSVDQFQIFKDGSNGQDRENDGEWKMRFSINFSQTGEVGATVSLRGGKTGVMLWAEREDTAALLQESQDELEEALAARGLEPGAIRCRHGHPPQSQKPVGAFMDNCS
jgi:hypothetical protein